MATSSIKSSPMKSSLTLAMTSKTEDQPTSAPKCRPPSLITVPIEVRLEIYHKFFEQSTLYVLRRRQDSNDEEVLEHLNHLFDISLLTTCRQIYEEALPIFYRSQTFHRSSNKVYAPQQLFSVELPLIAHLSLDVEICHKDRANGLISRRIELFAKHCPKLCTFTIYILRGNLNRRLTSKLTSTSATGRILRHLRSRLDRLSIVFLGCENTLFDLRSGVADESEWFYLNLFTWLYVTFSRIQKAYVDDARYAASLFSYHTTSFDQIYAWHTCRPELVEKMRCTNQASLFRETVNYVQIFGTECVRA
ncbi:hypothetical protein MMC28_001404 [Mycoblastus sanguinarius]|nr:hypothetical protein [Mycoblastus sanguinarius]